MKDSNDKVIRERIDGMSSVPSSSFDTNAAWGKLEMRLSPEKSKAFYWQPYGIAAGILLLLAMGLLFLNKPKVDHVVATKTEKVAQPLPVEKTVQQQAVDATGDANVNKPAFAKKQNPVSIPNTQKIAEPMLIEEEVTTPIDPPTPEQPVIAAAPRVVHINELMDEPVVEKPKAKEKQERFIDIVYASSQKVNHSKPSTPNNNAGNYGLLNLGFNKEN